jgi:FkbM family methyltransferase
MPPQAPLLETNGFNQLVRTRNGYCLYNRNDMYIGQALERYGEFSRFEMIFFAQLLHPGDIVIEVGANIGAHTVEIARHVGSQGRVIAFEPQRLIFQTLCANVALNSLDNVDCYPNAMGAQRGMLKVPELDPRKHTNFAGLSLCGEHQGRSVECFTLDMLVDLPRLRLVKIDVEGMESEVIAGGHVLIGKLRPLLYVENDRIEKSEALIRAIDALGYRMFWHQPYLFNPQNFNGESENIYPNTVSRNMLCMPHESTMEMPDMLEITDFTAHPSRT